MIDKYVRIKIWECFSINIQTIFESLTNNKILDPIRLFKKICSYFDTIKNRDKL